MYNVPAIKINIESDISDFERGLQGAVQKTKTAANDIGKSARKIEKDLGDAGERGGKKLQEGIKGALGEVRGELENMAGPIARFASAFGPVGTAVGVGLGAATIALKSTTNSIAEMADQARKAGVSVTQFQELQFVGSQARVNVDALTDGLKELQIRVDEFRRDGTGTGADALKRLGYSAEEASRKIKQPTEFLTELIGKIGELDTAAQKRVQEDLFGGEGGEQFANLVAMGAQKMRENVEAAREMGIVMDEGMVKRAEEIDRKFNMISATINSGMKTAVIETAEALASLMDNFEEFEDKSRSSQTSILDDTLANLKTAREDLAAAIAEGENSLIPTIGDVNPNQANIDRARGAVEALTAEVKKYADELGLVPMGPWPEGSEQAEQYRVALDNLNQTASVTAEQQQLINNTLKELNNSLVQSSGAGQAFTKLMQDIGNYARDAASQLGGLLQMMNGLGPAMGGLGNLTNLFAGLGGNLADRAAMQAAMAGGANPYATARRFNGAQEGRDGDILNEFFKKANQNIDPKMTAWCAAFINAALASNGIKGTGSLAARSFLNFGESTNEPQVGDIVVLKRGNNQDQGHVGFYEGRDPSGGIRVFGGNQSGGANSSTFRESDVLSYRRIPGTPTANGGPNASNEYTPEDRISERQIAAERALAEAKRETARAASASAAERKKAADAQVRAEKELKDSMEESRIKALEQGEALRSSLDPMYELKMITEEYTRLLKEGAIDQATFNEAIEQATQSANEKVESQRKKAQEIADKANEGFAKFRDMAKGWTTELSQGISQMIMGGEVDFAGMVRNWAAELLSSQIDNALQKLTEKFTNALTGIEGQASKSMSNISSMGGGGSKSFKKGPTPSAAYFNAPMGSGLYSTGTDRTNQGWALVGEKGPEYAYFGANGQVKNATETRNMMSEGGTSSFNSSITVNVNGGGGSGAGGEKDNARMGRMIGNAVSAQVKKDLYEHEAMKRRQM